MEVIQLLSENTSAVTEYSQIRGENAQERAAVPAAAREARVISRAVRYIKSAAVAEQTADKKFIFQAGVPNGRIVSTKRPRMSRVG